MRRAASFWVRLLLALSLVVGLTPVGAGTAHSVYGCATEFGREKADRDCGCKYEAAPPSKAKAQKVSRGKGKSLFTFELHFVAEAAASESQDGAILPRPSLLFGLAHLPYFGRSPPVSR